MRLITAAYLVPITGPIIPRGGLVIEGSQIAAVGEAESLVSRYPHLSPEHFPHAALMPGLVNAHTHLELTAYSVEAYSPHKSFARFLLAESDYKASLSVNDLKTALAQGLADSSNAGTTTLGDMGKSELLLPLIEKSGLRAVLFPEIEMWSASGREDRYQNALALMEEHSAGGAASPLIRVGLGPYAPYALSRSLLKMMANYSQFPAVPLQLHAAETFHEMEFFFDSKGDFAQNLFPQVGWGDALPPPHHRTPIQYLDAIGFLKSRPSLVAAVHTSSADLTALQKTGASLILTPRRNRFFGEGPAPLHEWLASGIPVGLGTDAAPISGSLSLWDEMRAALEIFSRSPKPITALELLSMASLGGASALGLGDRIGSLEAGKEADYLVVSLKDPLPTTETLASELIRLTRAEHVIEMAVAGKVKKQIRRDGA